MILRWVPFALVTTEKKVEFGNMILMSARFWRFPGVCLNALYAPKERRQQGEPTVAKVG